MTILTLALAIGANTAIFSLGNGLLLKSQPGIGHPEELVDFGRVNRESSFDTLSYPNYLDLATQSDVFSGAAAATGEPRSLSFRDDGAAQPVYGMLVTASYFDVLQVTPSLGRLFLTEDDRPGSSPAVVITDDFWTRQFGRAPSIVGRQIALNGHGFTVIGVAPPRFRGHSALRTDIWVPVGQEALVMPSSDLLNTRGSNWLIAVARLKSGVSVKQAQAALDVVAARLAQTYPDTNRDTGAKVEAHHGLPGQLHTAMTAFVGLLMAIVGIILAIACANVAGICIARSMGRQREIAVRVALGADRRRVILQVLGEMIGLFVVSGVSGATLATWMITFLKGFENSIPVPVAFDLNPDFRVALFTLGLTLTAAVVAGLAPAMASTRVDVVSGLKEESGGTAYRRLRLRNTLVVAQVALSLLLLIGSGLFFRALQRAKTLDPGFNAASVTVVNYDLFIAVYSEESGRAFDRELVTRVAALPGVESAGVSVDLPLDGNNYGFGGIRIPERQPPAPYRYFSADWNLVGPGYLKTMRIPLLRGRDFSDLDTASAPRVAIINEALVAMLWPGEEAIGKRLYNGPIDSTPPTEVIGVTKNVQERFLGSDPEPFVFAPVAQLWEARRNLVIRTSSASTVAPAVRQLLQGMNPNLPIIAVQPMNEVAAFALLPQQMAVWIAGSMGIAGMLLASLGI